MSSEKIEIVRKEKKKRRNVIRNNPRNTINERMVKKSAGTCVYRWTPEGK